MILSASLCFKPSSGGPMTSNDLWNACNEASAAVSAIVPDGALVATRHHVMGDAALMPRPPASGAKIHVAVSCSNAELLWLDLAVNDKDLASCRARLQDLLPAASAAVVECGFVLADELESK